MTPDEVKSMRPGLYRIHWKPEYGGGYSLAAVGILHMTARRWMAPADWTSVEVERVASTNNWDEVMSYETIAIC